MWACLQPSSWCNHQDPCGGPGRGKYTGHIPPTPPTIIPRRRLLSLPASPPHFHLPPATSVLLVPAPPISSCSIGGPAGLEEGGNARTVSPRTVSTSLPQSSWKHPPKSCPRSRIPGVTELCQADTVRIQSLPPPPGNERHTHWPARPWAGIRIRQSNWQKWSRKDPIWFLLSTSHPHPGATEPCCQSPRQARGLGTARSFHGVSQQCNFHVFPKSEEVGDRTVGDSHLGNSGSSESSCDCSSGSLSASLGCTACWDTGGLKYHLSPPARMRAVVGGGWEKREEVEPGAGPELRAGLPYCHLACAVSSFSVLQTSSSCLWPFRPSPSFLSQRFFRLGTLTDVPPTFALVTQPPLTPPPSYSPTHTLTDPVSTKASRFHLWDMSYWPPFSTLLSSMLQALFRPHDLLLSYTPVWSLSLHCCLCLPHLPDNGQRDLSKIYRWLCYSSA